MEVSGEAVGAMQAYLRLKRYILPSGIAREALQAALPFIALPSAARELALEEAAKVAEAFRNNDWIAHDMRTGVFPNKSEPGVAIAAAIRALSSPDHPDAGKVEGEQSAAALDVLAERRRQFEAEGWTPEHDDQHSNGEMARAASCYITNKERSHLPTVPLKWPWSDAWWKPDGYRRNLVKAGALILAEIDRLDRLATHPSGGDRHGD